MSSRRTSASSSTSSRETSPEEYDDREEAEERLKALEKLLALQFFAAPEEEEEAPIDDRPKKKRKKQVEGTEATDAETTKKSAVVAVEEKVAFRLFSTQTGLQTVIIREKEQNDIVLDPRIRDVSDETKEVRKERTRKIKSIVIDGETILAQSTSQPDTIHKSRLTTRILALPRLPPSLNLAYLNSHIPTPSPKRLKISKSTLLVANLLPRHPELSIIDKIHLKIIPILKEDTGLRKSLVVPIVGAGRKRKRLSQARREGLRKKVRGENGGIAKKK